MGSPTIFNGRRTKLLTADGVLTSAGRTIDYDGAINYIPNSGAKIVITGYNAYANTAQAAPVNGTGGAPTVTVTRSTVTPLFGPASILFTKPASNVQGNGFSYDFAIDSGVSTAGTPCTITGYYNVASGTFANGDMTIWIYDITNGVVIQPTGSTINNNIGAATMQCEFQPATNSTSYRLIFQVSSVSTLAYTVQFDTLAVRPNTYNPGAAVTATQNYTPVISATTTAPTPGTNTLIASWYRVGDRMRINYSFQQTTAGSGGSGDYLFPLPTGYQIDTSKVPTDNQASLSLGVVGFGEASNFSTGSSRYVLDVRVYNSTNLRLWTQSTSTATGAIGSTSLQLATATINYSFEAEVPILGWGVTQVLSSDTDTRVVAMEAYISSNTAVASNGPIKYNVVVQDTHGAYNTSTGLYTAPVSGFYRVSASGLATGSAGETYISINGATTGMRMLSSYSTSTIFSGSATVKVNAGDTIGVFGNTATTMVSADVSNFATNVSIERLSGPTQIAASEKVSASYYTTANQTVSTTQTFNFDAKLYDSHGAVSASPAGSGAWKFTAPRPGIYTFKGMFSLTSGTPGIKVYKNGTAFKYISFATGSLAFASDDIQLNAGDYIDFRSDTSLTAYGAGGLGSNTQSWISITSQG